MVDYCNGWKFNIGENVWWIAGNELVEVQVIKRTVKSNYSEAYNEYLLKSLVSNYCFWERESNINKIIENKKEGEI